MQNIQVVDSSVGARSRQNRRKISKFMSKYDASLIDKDDGLNRDRYFARKGAIQIIR
jgi:hypothetical protein